MTVDPTLPAILTDITVTAACWRTEYKVGTLGHRYLITQRGATIADTGWLPTFPEAAAAYAGAFLLVSAAGSARFRDPN